MTTYYRQKIDITLNGFTVTRTLEESTENRLRFRVDRYLAQLDPAFDIDVEPIETFEKENQS